MIEKLKNTLDILKCLENQDATKFISSNFNDINNMLDLDLKSYDFFEKEVDISKFSDEEKELISNIIYKIDKLETKVIPKANLISSFSNSLS